MPLVIAAEYPRARYDRALTGAVGLAGLAGGALPRARIVPFLLNETATSRRTVSTPGIQGPALLRGVSFNTATFVTPPTETFEIGWALFPFAEAGVPISSPRPYTLLTELQDPFAVAAPGSGQGFPNITVPSTRTPYEFSVNILIPEDRFVFCVAVVNTGANAQLWSGHLTIYEGLDLFALPGYLGN